MLDAQIGNTPGVGGKNSEVAPFRQARAIGQDQLGMLASHRAGNGIDTLR